MTTQRPRDTEYEAYYGRYISLVPDGDIGTILEKQREATSALLAPLDTETADFRYAEGKWSVKEVVGHIIDAERVFAFRAFAFSRNDPNAIPGMEQDDYARGANYGDRSLRDIVEEYRAVRSATLHLLRSFDNGMLLRTGTASGCSFTVRSTMYIIAGHELHHLRGLKERYLIRRT